MNLASRFSTLVPVVFSICIFGCQHTPPSRNEMLIYNHGPMHAEGALLKVPLNPENRGKKWELRSGDGTRLAVQQVGPSEGICFLPVLPSGHVKKFQLRPANPTREAAMKAEATPASVKFTHNGKEIASYQIDSRDQAARQGAGPDFFRGGYLHPVFTPDGNFVTDDYATNHMHHHGIWTAWTKTAFEGRTPDFWNMGQKKARVEHLKLIETWNGEVSSGLRALLFYEDLKALPPKTVLHEEWRLEFLNSHTESTPYHLFDLTLSQTNVSGSPLELPTYHYGGLGFRGHAQIQGKNPWLILTSEGITDRIKANESRGNWCDLSGLVDGKISGVTIFCHPGNFRAPQPMRVNPTEPFFCYAPQQMGLFQIPPGGTYTARYRFLIHDGPISREQADRVFLGFSDTLFPKKTADAGNHMR